MTTVQLPSPPTLNNHHPTHPLITIKNLTRTFQRGPNTVHALRDTTLTINHGEFIALVGPSGSGKSTLLNLLGGLDRPTSGQLWLNDTPWHELSPADLTNQRQQQIGFIFQSFNLLPRLTALENVAVPLMLAGVPLAERQARAQTLLEQVGLGHRLDHYPPELSGGEQQRAAVARALINNPAIILADEPTGNLDSTIGDTIMDLLRQLNQDHAITLVVVTHDPEVAAYADRIVRLADGHITNIETKTTPTKTTPPPPRPTPSPRSQLTFTDITRTAFRNLGRRRVRNILTASGVLIGIITLVAMVSFGVGVQREVQRNFEAIGLENLFINPQFDEGDGFDPFAEPTPLQPLTPELVDTIAQLDNVVQVNPVLSLPRGMEISLLIDDQAKPIYIQGNGVQFGFGPPALASLAAGQTLLNQTDGALLVTGLADQLLQEGQTYDDLIGKEIRLLVQLPRGESQEFPMTIVGIQNGFEQRSLDIAINERARIRSWWFDDPDFLTTTGYDEIIVQATNIAATGPLKTQIEAQFDVRVQSLDIILDTANQVLSLLQALLGSVGGLALLVAALGVANTMMMAIYERTREIGVLKALGASTSEIRRLFTIEAGLIGFIGGCFGLLFGIIIGDIVDWIGHRYLINEGVTGVGDLSVVPWWLALGAILFAIFIGVIAGLYPAHRAAQLDPVTALRHE
ncbi:MAG TPA: ATP-binding cassette domain-containing protein [Anaerolineae bacterium]|nr:ATP-binding cassette domain-containing protein [Anaerolineae bacterium]